MGKEKTAKNFIVKGRHTAAEVGRKKHMVFRVLILIFPLLIGVSVGMVAYAKYYSVSSQQGIAIATGIYFTANYAVETTAEGEFVESLAKSDYQGGDASFFFEIRNYENNLLFNESDVEIPYSVEFWLGETPTDATYTVTVGDGGTPVTLRYGEAQKVTIEGQSIAGGAARKNQYMINVDANGTNHEAIPIYVHVKTADGALIDRILKGKMIMNNSTKVESYIESQEFVVPDETDNMDPVEKFKIIQGLSGLTYEIRTVGDVAGEGVTEELILSWDPSVLQIDLFDSAYTQWLAKEQAAGNAVTGPVTDPVTGWQSITVQAMPYAAQSVAFFRGTDFSTKATDLDTLHSFIEASKKVSATALDAE